MTARRDDWTPWLHPLLTNESMGRTGVWVVLFEGLFQDDEDRSSGVPPRFRTMRDVEISGEAIAPVVDALRSGDAEAAMDHFQRAFATAFFGYGATIYTVDQLVLDPLEMPGDTPGQPLSWSEAQAAARRGGHRLIDAGQTRNGARLLRCTRCGGYLRALTPHQVYGSIALWSCVPNA